MKRHVLDQLIAKGISRKLLVFLISTIFLLLGFVAPGDWMVITGIYLGIQGAQDTLGDRTRIRHSTQRASGGCEELPE